MKVIEALESLGYIFTVQGDGLAYEHFGSLPDPEQVRLLLDQLKTAKAEAMAYLQKRPFTRHSKRIVVFPANTRLGFPSGTWRRLADGRIEACLSYAEMETIRYWRDEVIGGGG